jgi:hypothetical protein
MRFSASSSNSTYAPTTLTIPIWSALSGPNARFNRAIGSHGGFLAGLSLWSDGWGAFACPSRRALFIVCRQQVELMSFDVSSLAILELAVAAALGSAWHTEERSLRPGEQVAGQALRQHHVLPAHGHSVRALFRRQRRAEMLNVH